MLADKNDISYWACLVIANVWIAGGDLSDVILGFVWLGMALMILIVGRYSRKCEGDKG